MADNFAKCVSKYSIPEKEIGFTSLKLTGVQDLSWLSQTKVWTPAKKVSVSKLAS